MPIKEKLSIGVRASVNRATCSDFHHNSATTSALSNIRMIPSVIKNLANWFMGPTPESEDYQYKLSAVLIVKDDAYCAAEMIAFHLVQGFDHFYVVDNDSSDGLKSKLDPFIRSGLVTYTIIHGRGMQLPAYNQIISSYKNQTKYLAVLDADEFLMTESPNETVIQILDSLFSVDKNIGGVGVNWLIYGSSNLAERDMKNTLLIDSFINRSEDDFEANAHIKTIVNPRKVFNYANPHFPEYYPGVYSVNEQGKPIRGPWSKNSHKRLRINHYYGRSKAEFEKKLLRGLADRTGNSTLRTWDAFTFHDRNEVFDSKASIFSSKVKEILASLPD